jgi:glucose/arabinose dehydrogenase
LNEKGPGGAAALGWIVLALLPLAAGCGGSGDGGTRADAGGSGAPGGSCAAGAPVTPVASLTARLVASGLRNPLDLQAVPGDRSRLYVVEQGGRIRVVRDGQLSATPFLDVSDRIASGGERGLLGLAFHPRFAANGRLFVNYTDRAGDTHLAEFRAGAADAADPASERTLLVVAQPFANHNGGGLAFGNDGMLYAGLGDGGSGGDPLGNGQRLDTLLGKLLRLDVDAATPYAVPADNPFRAAADARPEIWAYGLRNPFRFGFDRASGDLYVGDVGQGAREEVDVGLAARRGGENYGWNVTEGTLCYQPASGCNRSGQTPPVYEYGHDQGCSITGGVVYRGCRMPSLAGSFFFGDYCRGFVRSLRVVNGQASELREWPLSEIGSVAAFGADADGEPYVVDYDGEVYALEPAG